MGTLQLDCKLVKVSYNDTVPMKEYDKIFLDVFNSSKVWMKCITLCNVDHLQCPRDQSRMKWNVTLCLH